MLRVITNKTNSVAVLRVQGRMVGTDTKMLRTTIMSLTDTSVVVLDLSRVNTIDAGGLGVMLELRGYAESRGIEFKLKNVTKLVRGILELTRLDSVFDVTYGGDPAIPSPRRFDPPTQSNCCA